MFTTAKQFVKEVDEIKTIAKREILSEGFNNLSEEQFSLMQKMFKLLDTSEEMLLKQAEMMDGMNKKLDKILSIAEA